MEGDRQTDYHTNIGLYIVGYWIELIWILYKHDSEQNHDVNSMVVKHEVDPAK